MSYDCVVIGGGLSGLAAGIRLAHYKKKVAIFERHHRLGGLNSWYRRGNLEFETGLHAMTNFASRGANKALPLLKLLRQLRIPHDALQLREQNYSLISFPDHELRFSNDFNELEESVATNFASEIDGFRNLDKYIKEFDAYNLGNEFQSAREVLGEHLKSQKLIDMIFCPLMFYGSSLEDDMDFTQFSIMYRSIFHEGFCRPGGRGIRGLLDLLEKRFIESGGVLFRKCGISEIATENGEAKSVIDDTGKCHDTKTILSSAGWLETMSLCEKEPTANTWPTGQLAFTEVIAAMKPEFLKKLDFSIMFYSQTPRFTYRRPKNLIDMKSGVVCLPRNFKFANDDKLPPSSIRLTSLANYDSWKELDKLEYSKRKDEIISQSLQKIETLVNINEIQKNSDYIDLMTPLTVERYTGHINGAIYGSPQKQRDGSTHLPNLFVCGTDQGFLGIVGAILSGISIANGHLLR